MKKVFLFFMVAFLSLGLFSCEGKTTKKQVFIIEYVSAPALDDAKDGIIEGLKAAGFVNGENIKITVLNPQAKADTLAQMAEQAVSEADLIFAIATPVALSVKAEAEKQGSDVPILFTAVTDAVESGILSSNTQPGGNISGTSDMNPVDEQIGLATRLNIDGLKMGFIYTSGESNSQIQLALAKAAASVLGISLTDYAVTNVAQDLDITLTTIVEQGINVVYVPTDNEMNANMNHISEFLGQHGVITICGEDGQIEGGGTLTVGSVNYFELGKMTGDMGAKVLNGTKVGTLDVGFYSGTGITVNVTEINKYNLPVPQEIILGATKKY